MATTMSFSRAFSTKRQKPDIEISAPIQIGRAASQRGGRPIYRQQISSPLALVSTSNAQVAKANNIAGTSPIEIRHVSSGSTSSSDESDISHGSSVHSRETTITDASSVDESPISTEPEPNHLTSYFKPAVDTHKHAKQSPSISSRPSLDLTIPARAPSHSKKAHEGVHRKRSIQRMLSPPPSRERVASTEIFNPNRAGIVEAPPSAFVEAPRDNPFGNELAQLDAVAEEFGQVVRCAEADADHVYMESHGLAYFSASDYMCEIQSLIHEMFSDERGTVYDLGNFF